MSHLLMGADAKTRSPGVQHRWFHLSVWGRASSVRTHTLTSACKLLLQEGVPLSRSSRWSKLDPNCASHVLSLHSSHRAQHPLFSRNMAILERPRGSLDGTLTVVKIFSKTSNIWIKKYPSCCAGKKTWFLTGTVPRTLILLMLLIHWF